MHIPDGFLSAQTWVPAWVASLAGLGFCFRKVRYTLKDKTIPLMGVMAAFIFAAQMLNFPVIGGTSGHLIGGVLAAVFLGPYAAAIIMAVVLTAQCFLFQDGGITTLGANIINMALVSTFSGYTVYSFIRKIFSGKAIIIPAIAVASWFSVVITSLLCSLELAWSGTVPLRIVMPAMLFIHVLIGIGEAIITGFIVRFVLNVRPDLLYQVGQGFAGKKEIFATIVMAVILALFLSPFASSWPDGLEQVAHTLGFLGRSKGVVSALLPDYLVPGIKNEKLATSIAGGVGTILLFAMGYAIALLVRGSKEQDTR